MSTESTLLATFKHRMSISLTVLFFCILSSVLTYLGTRYYDFQRVQQTHSQEVSVLQNTINTLQASLGHGFTEQKKLIEQPVILEMIPIPEDAPTVENEKQVVRKHKG